MSKKQRETRSKIPESARTGSKLNLQIKTYDPSNSFIVSLCLFLALFAVLWFCVQIKLNSMGMLTYFLSPIYALILLCHLLVHFSAIGKGTKKADKTPLIHRSLISHGFLIISFMGGCDTGFGSGYCTLDAVFSELEPHGSTNIPGWLPWSANVPGWLPWFFLLGFPFLIVSWWALYKLGRPQAPTELTNLAALYKATGRYAEAEPLYKQSLVIAEKALGPEHPGVAWKLQGLAGLYADQGRYADAEPLYKRALVIREKALGPNHPDVGLSLNSIAVLYDRQGRYAEAESLNMRALAIRETALGFNHPQVATSLNNLAELYRSQGRYAEAEPLNKRALAIFAKALGPEHPDVAQSLENYAGLLRETGRSEEAEELEARAQAIRAKYE